MLPINNKKAVFFSTDALIATILIILAIFTIYPLMKYSHHESRFSGDIISSLSSLKIGEMQNSYVSQLIASGKITDLNKSVLEQIGEFYVKNLTEARLLAENIFLSLNKSNNFGIWYGEDLIYSSNRSAYEFASDVEVDRQFISGIKKGNSTGFSAKAYLTKSLPSSYFYFGGYVGEGNLSMNVSYEGELKNIFLETVINKEFDIYINNVFSGHYDKSSSEIVPARYDLSSYLNRFHNGSNLIELRGNNLYIAGGYLKFSYAGAVNYKKPTVYNFPGIKGIINFYDGIDIPKNISSLEIYLHLKTNYTAFLILGNTTLFSNRTNGEQNILLNNAFISSLINYQSYAGKTIPIRLGLETINLSGVTYTGKSDVVLVTDFSGSMKKAINDDTSQGSASIVCSNLAAYPNARKTELAKCLDKSFIDNVLNNTQNRLWPVYLYNNIISYYDDPQNAVAIKADIDSYSQGKEQTCLSCAINKGYDLLLEHNDVSRAKYIVLMTDGIPTHCSSGSCNSNSSIYGTQYCQGYCDFQGGGGSCVYEGCGDNTCANPINNTLYSALRAKNDLNITIYTVGFGLVENCGAAANLLREIANITGGKYYSSSNATELEKIYREISAEFLEASYAEQTLNASGNFQTTILYPDSYIKINSSEDSRVYGSITNFETQFSDNNGGIFFLPPNSSVLESKAISYSGARWTNYIRINNFLAYNLSIFGFDYSKLGDPYSINFDSSLLLPGINYVNITTGISPSNITSGSSSNKIIVTLIRNASSFSPISSFAEGCSWHIEFDDLSNLTILIPANYSGVNSCYYSSLISDYDSNDALQNAVYSLLKSVDYDLDNRVDIKFSEQDLDVSSFTIVGIPYSWNTEVQIRRWF
jgi:hypothetical protein